METVLLHVLVAGILSISTTMACQPEHPDEATPSSAHRCELITEIPLCGQLYYKYASFPNLRNHQSQSEANRELVQLDIGEVLEVECDGLMHLLCSIYAPFCSKELPSFVPIPPCKELCEYTKMNCNPVLEEHGLTWPATSVLNCSTYITSSEDQSCISPGTIFIAQQLQPQLPDTTLLGPLESFDVTAQGPHALTFSWRPPKEVSNREECLYTLICGPNFQGFPRSFNCSTELVTLEGFHASTEYNCSVATVSNGQLGHSTSRAVRTLAHLGLQFVNDTPVVDNTTISATFEASRSTSRISCQLLSQTAGHSPLKDCSAGSVTFAFLAPGKYTVRVVAKNSRYDKVTLRRRVKVPSGPDFCAVYHINAEVTISETGNATAEFRGAGPVEEFECRLDDGDFGKCTSPYFLSNLNDHNHSLKIIPNGRRCRGRKYTCTIKF